MTETPIVARRLCRQFGGDLAVCNVSFAVPRGQVFAFIGRNGAGKTTTMRMLLGLLAPTSGEALLLGETSTTLSPQARARVGYMAEGCVMYDWMRVHECIAFQRAFYPRFNMPLCRAVVDAFRLREGQKVGQLSHGQRAGLNLAVVLATEPEVLLLDDPVMGLDPVARRLLLEAMVHFSQRAESTIMFSTHLLADVERVADGIAVLDRGSLRACCTVDTFVERIRRFAVHYDEEPPPLPELSGLVAIKRLPRELQITLATGEDDVLRVIKETQPTRIEPLPLSFEDAAIAYLGGADETRFVMPSTP